jgi:hypothetical protein
MSRHYIEVEIDLDEFSDAELDDELAKRRKNRGEECSRSETLSDVLIREALEDRDWRKIEQLAEVQDISWLRRKRA